MYLSGTDYALAALGIITISFFLAGGAINNTTPMTAAITTSVKSR
jgi:hypothetical protein